MTFWKLVWPEIKYKILATAIVLTCWMVFAELVTHFLGERYVVAVLSVMAGWYWLGKAVIPWVESKLTPKS